MRFRCQKKKRWIRTVVFPHPAPRQLDLLANKLLTVFGFAFFVVTRTYTCLNRRPKTAIVHVWLRDNLVRRNVSVHVTHYVVIVLCVIIRRSLVNLRWSFATYVVRGVCIEFLSPLCWKLKLSFGRSAEIHTRPDTSVQYFGLSKGRTRFNVHSGYKYDCKYRCTESTDVSAGWPPKGGGVTPRKSHLKSGAGWLGWRWEIRAWVGWKIGAVG